MLTVNDLWHQSEMPNINDISLKLYKLRKLYEDGIIKSEDDFRKEMQKCVI